MNIGEMSMLKLRTFLGMVGVVHFHHLCHQVTGRVKLSKKRILHWAPSWKTIPSTVTFSLITYQVLLLYLAGRGVNSETLDQTNLQTRLHQSEQENRRLWERIEQLTTRLQQCISDSQKKLEHAENKIARENLRYRELRNSIKQSSDSAKYTYLQKQHDEVMREIENLKATMNGLKEDKEILQKACDGLIKEGGFQMIYQWIVSLQHFMVTLYNRRSPLGQRTYRLSMGQHPSVVRLW